MSTSGLWYHDFIRLLFVTSVISFVSCTLHTSHLANLKGSVDLILSKVSAMKLIAFSYEGLHPLDLSSWSFIQSTVSLSSFSLSLTSSRPFPRTFPSALCLSGHYVRPASQALLYLFHLPEASAERFRYVLQSVRKCSCVDTARKQKQRLGQCLFVCLMCAQQTSYIP